MKDKTKNIIVMVVLGHHEPLGLNIYQPLSRKSEPALLPRELVIKDVIERFQSSDLNLDFDWLGPLKVPDYWLIGQIMDRSDSSEL